MEPTPSDLTPLAPPATFLQRVFDVGSYGDERYRLIDERIFKPRKDCEEFSLPDQIDWEARDRIDDRNWRMQLQAWNFFNPIMNFFDSLDDKQPAVDFFFSVAADWWEHYGGDPDDIVTTRMPDSYAWYDMSVGCRALAIGFMSDRIAFHGLAIEPEQQTLLTSLADKHTRHLRHPDVFSDNNHGIFQAHGLMALARLAPGDDPDPVASYAASLMDHLVSSQFDEHGIHREHSPHYHFYVLDAFENVMLSGWYPEGGTSATRIRLAATALRWLVDPRRRPVCVGDSLLTEQARVKFPAHGDQPVASSFESSGYAVVRSGWATPPEDATMVFVMGGYHSKAHKHRDCLSFDWFDGGERIICDSGKYGYRTNQWRRYALSSRAHNSVEIEDFDILRMKPYGSILNAAYVDDDGIFRLGGSLKFPAVRHDREIYCKPGRWLIVADTLRFARARAFNQWFHLDGRFQLVSASGGSVHASDRDGNDVYLDCLDRDLKVSCHRGDEDAMQGFLYTRDYEVGKGLAIGFGGRDTRRQPVTLIALSDEARHEALAYARSHSIVETDEVGGPLGPEPGPLLPKISHVGVLSPAELSLANGEATYSCRADGIPFSFYANVRRSGPIAGRRRTKKLLCMFPGASDRARGHRDFQRYTWSPDFPEHDVIAFTDPTLRPENEIGLAWFQYDEQRPGLDALRRLLTALVERNGYDPSGVTFFGSSGGGFVALQLADTFPDATVIAINPQIHLFNYTKTHYEAMLETCYPGLTDREVRTRHPDRLSVSIDIAARRAPTVIFQNTDDVRHVERHVKLLMKSLPDDSTHTHEPGTEPVTVAPGRLDVVWYTDPGSGHSPPGRETTVSMISPLLA